MSAGGLGVDLFFALSAYLITELLVREFEQRGGIDVKAFYVRRALRIWPLYYAFLLIGFFVLPHILTNSYIPRAHAVAYSIFAGNWSVAAFGYPGSPAAPLWSVSIEEQFYVAWPLLVAALGIRRLPLIAVVCLVVATLTRILLAAIGVEHPAVWTNTFARLDPIALGALLAVVLCGRAPRLHVGVRGALLVAGAAAWVICMVVFGLSGWGSLVTYPVVAIASIGMMLAFLRDGAPAPRGPVYRALIHLGRISYGLYVFHALALDIARQTTGHSWGLPREQRRTRSWDDLYR